MTPPFTFVVRHRAAPQGSKDLRTNSRGGKYMTESSAGVKPFRTALRRAALGPDGLTMAKFTGAVVVSIAFEFKQAKSNTDPYPTGKNIGDVDKLTRAVLDGLVAAQVIEDDSLVINLRDVTKRWGAEDRAIITVSSAEEERAQSIVAFSGCACDKITCRECSARRGVLPARLDESGPPRFLPLPRNPFETGGCPEHGIEPCYGIEEWPHH